MQKTPTPQAVCEASVAGLLTGEPRLEKLNSNTITVIFHEAAIFFKDIYITEEREMYDSL